MKKCVINTKTDSIIVFIAPNGCIGLLRIEIPRILMDKVLRIFFSNITGNYEFYSISSYKSNIYFLRYLKIV